jgi:phosphoribosylformylglycinamidine synthase subunit PurL
MTVVVNPSFDFKKLSSQEIHEILAKERLALKIDEALKIQDLLGRSPTLAECVLWSIQGSEHCSYKSTRKHLKTLPTEAPNVILGPKEDAGVVTVAQDKQGRRFGIVVSHESHNHPSQIVPYEGAATGVGGNVRDVCCMGAEVIAVADCLRFGDLRDAHTHFIDEGVVAGIAGYGNPLGIPNLAGDVYYDNAYQDNCLVTVVTLGLVREDHLIHSFVPKGGENYDLILVGKPTDNSGFGGASFSSLTLNEEDLDTNKGAVQEPNAFLGRHLLKANYALFKYLQEHDLISKVGFKDLGAGGIACASVEIADAGGFGSEVYLEKVHVAMDNLPPQVILCAETQERYLWAVPPELTPVILKHYNETFALPKVSPGAAASLIGKVRKDGRYVVSYHGEIIVDAKAKDVTSGILYDRPHQRAEKELSEPTLAEHDLAKTLLKLLAHENIASRAPIFECYDKQVQGRTLIERGQAAAGVLMPFNDDSYPAEIRNVGVALATSANPRYGKIDAYWTAYNAVVDAMRKVAAVGAKPEAITDCLCFGNPEKTDVMQEIIDAINGLKEACSSISLQDYPKAPTPIISGNVSLYNESSNQQVPASPIVSCIGVIEDASCVLTPDFKKVASKIIMLGQRLNECGGSSYYQLFDVLGKNIPQPEGKKVAQELYALNALAKAKLINACQVISDGGIAIAFALMSFKHEIGFTVEIPGDLTLARLLFSQSGGFILEISPEKFTEVSKILTKFDVCFAEIGNTTEAKTLSFNHAVAIDLIAAKSAWQQGLRAKRNE